MKVNIEKGFSLVELLVVIGLIAFIGTLVAPFLLINTQSSSLESETKSFVSALKRVQVRSKAREANSNYGIKLSSNKYSIYSGVDYANAAQITDVSFAVGNTLGDINLSGGATEINFNDNSIIPKQYGYFVLTNISGSYRVYINKEGLIYYQKQ